jgi:hypothetical protein
MRRLIPQPAKETPETPRFFMRGRAMHSERIVKQEVI